MGISFSLDAAIGLTAAQQLHDVIRREIDFDGIHARIPRSVSVDGDGNIAYYHYGSDTIRGTTYMEWDKEGDGDPDDIVVYARIRRVSGL